MVLGRDKFKKLLKVKGVKSLEDFNAFMRDASKDVIETLLDVVSMLPSPNFGHSLVTVNIGLPTLLTIFLHGFGTRG